MIKIISAVALAVMIVTTASAQSVKPKKHMTTGTWMTEEQKARATGYSPSGNRQWDVYVRGEYVGSDPDPRVRSTLRREAVRNYGFR